MLPGSALLLRGGAVFVDVKALGRGGEPIDEGGETNGDEEE